MCQGNKTHEMFLKQLASGDSSNKKEKESMEEIIHDNGWVKVYDRGDKSNEKKKKRFRFMKRKK